MLIDGDLRRPMVATLFDIDTGIGLTQVLSGAVPLDEALVETDTVGLHVLPAGRIPHNPSEVVGSERMRDLIAELSSDHLVVIDAPPALPVTDAMIMAQRVDGIIVVTFMAKSRKEHLEEGAAARRGGQRPHLRHRPQRHPAGPAPRGSTATRPTATRPTTDGSASR